LKLERWGSFAVYGALGRVKVTGALLVIAGEKDVHTTLKESKELFKKANKPKELWVVKGAKHVDFDALLGKEYEEKILDFLDEYME